MTKPQIEWRLSLGNILTVATIIGSVAFAYGQTNQRITGIDERTAQTFAELRSDILRNERDIEGSQDRLRTVEDMAGRQDATLDLILEAINEIKGRVERIDARVGGQR